MSVTVYRKLSVKLARGCWRCFASVLTPRGDDEDVVNYQQLLQLRQQKWQKQLNDEDATRRRIRAVSGIWKAKFSPNKVRFKFVSPPATNLQAGELYSRKSKTTKPAVKNQQEIINLPAFVYDNKDETEHDDH